MIRTMREGFIFQRDWAGRGERGFRDQMLMPAIFFGAVSPGLYISSLFTDFLPGLWASLIMNIAGYGVTHLLYLGKMERFWRGLLNIRHSWISRGILFNILFTVFSTGFIILKTLEGGAESGLLIFLCKWVSLVSALLFLAYPGFMLSFVKAIPFWRSAVEPTLFFLQGIMGGIAVQLLMGAAFSLEQQVSRMLLRIDFLLLIAVLVIMLSALVIKSLHGDAERVSVMYLLGIHPATKDGGGAFFLVGAISGGLLIPIALLAVMVVFSELSGISKALVYPAMMLQLVGIYLAKYGFIRAGAYTPPAPKV